VIFFICEFLCSPAADPDNQAICVFVPSHRRKSKGPPPHSDHGLPSGGLARPYA
jgi:hypothetical protein